MTQRDDSDSHWADLIDARDALAVADGKLRRVDAPYRVITALSAIRRYVAAAIKEAE